MRLAALLVFAGVCAAQPVITDLQPRGAQKGRPFLLNVVGRYLDGAKVESAMPATFTPMAPEKGIMGATFLVEPAAEITAGVYPIRVITPEGLSNIQLLSVGTFPELTEDESRPGSLPNTNDTIESAQPLPAGPLVVNGKLKGPERDVYRLSAKSGERQVIEVEARRAGSAIDPVIELQDASGKVLARSEDAMLAGLDARLDYTFPREGLYYVTVHDARFSAQAINYYRLKTGSYTYPQEIFPLGGRKGESVEISLGTQKVKTELKPSREMQRQAFVNLPDSPTLPIPIAIGDDPEVMEPAAEALTAPVTINGRLAKAAEKDTYKVKVTPGEWLTLKMQARELGTSKLMGVITVTDEKGKQIARTGDEPLAEDFYNVNQSRTAGDPVLRFQVPEGVTTIKVAVEDLALRGGSNYAYRLNVRRQAQDLRVFINTPYINIPAGGSVSVPVTVERHGYDGDVQLRVMNAPKGLKVEGGTVVSVPAIKEVNRVRSSPGVLVLTAQPGVKFDPTELTIEAVAKTESGQEWSRRAIGPGMIVAVAGATQQGSVDRQKALTAPWLGRELPVAQTKAPPATLAVELIARKRMAEGDELKFRWKWNPRDPMQPLPKLVRGDMVGAADVRVIDAKVDKDDKTSGTFLMTTTKLTRPAKYDMYVTGQLMVDGQAQDIISRPITVEVLEVESTSVAQTGSNR
ncbi:MAG: hypothetical protein IT168_03800 [Bryobacterales bacterium]|nr:hypothetical protein [Bryobacterales bacterium]